VSQAQRFLFAYAMVPSESLPFRPEFVEAVFTLNADHGLLAMLASFPYSGTELAAAIPLGAGRSRAITAGADEPHDQWHR
jgi:hypothetical protein